MQRVPAVDGIVKQRRYRSSTLLEKAVALTRTRHAQAQRLLGDGHEERTLKAKRNHRMVPGRKKSVASERSRRVISAVVGVIALRLPASWL